MLDRRRTPQRLATLLAPWLVTVLVTSCGAAADIAGGEQTSQTTSTTPTDSTATTSEPPTESSPTDATSSQPTTEPTTEPTSEPTPAVAPPPKVGNCYPTREAAFQRLRDGSSPVSCDQPHTAETFAVFQVGPVPDNSRVNEIWRVCQVKFKRYVGDSPTVSKLSMTVILPSGPQAAAGQGWARCDAIELVNNNGKAGKSRTGSVKGALEGGVPRDLRGCVRRWPTANKPIQFTPCTERHQAELIPESKNLGGPNAKFPGLNASKTASKQFCEAVFQDYVPETLNYYYYYPTAQSWQSGSHDTTCWALDVSGDGLPPI